MTPPDPDRLPGEGLPLLNAMGVNQAATKGILNQWVKEQLTAVYHATDQYVPMHPRGYGDDTEMPHEWGSMDTYDDMRNSMRAATMMMDVLLDPFNTVDPRDYLEWHRNLITDITEECGPCAIEVNLRLAWPDEPDPENEAYPNSEIVDIIWERIEQRQAQPNPED